MQDTWVQSLIWEEATCHGGTKPCVTTTEPVLWSPGDVAQRAAEARAH